MEFEIEPIFVPDQGDDDYYPGGWYCIIRSSSLDKPHATPLYTRREDAVDDANRWIASQSERKA